MDPKSVFLVIPAFNEGRVIRSVIEALLTLPYSIVVVDDGSSDVTYSVLADLPVHLIRHPINFGQGAALQTGTTYALQQGAEVVVHFDADGQHPANQIEELIAPIVQGRADVALGCRFLRRTDAQLVPFQKRVLLRGGIVVSWLFTRVWLHDTHNGFRALSRQAAAKIQLRENGFAHATEILEQIRRTGLRRTEVATTINYSDYSRAKGQSSFNAINIVVELMLGKILR
jgi:glycosyltransferase involved in cell wall biosynthesis